jgi:hypothetical protein
MATTLGETAFAVAVQSGAVPLAWMTGAAAGGLFEACEAAVVVAVVPAVARRRGLRRGASRGAASVP